MTIPTDDELLRVYYAGTRAECEVIRGEVFPWTEGGSYRAVIQEAERIDRAGVAAVRKAVIEALAAEAEAANILPGFYVDPGGFIADWLHAHLPATRMPTNE